VANQVVTYLTFLELADAALNVAAEVDNLEGGIAVE
jgi:hypothetical protein